MPFAFSGNVEHLYEYLLRSQAMWNVCMDTFCVLRPCGTYGYLLRSQAMWNVWIPFALSGNVEHLYGCLMHSQAK
eukprot:1138932-Pelagomonas_calceolata.AAC.1